MSSEYTSNLEYYPKNSRVIWSHIQKDRVENYARLSGRRARRCLVRARRLHGQQQGQQQQGRSDQERRAG
jgi:hypothetical protein